MKKLISILLAALTLFALCGCGGEAGDPVVEISTPQPGASVIEPVPTDVPDFTPEPTEAVTEAPTEAPTAEPTAEPTAAPTEEATAEPTAAATEQTPGNTPEQTVTSAPAVTTAPTQSGSEPDQAVFDNAVFIGNSIFEGLYRFGIITHGKFYTKVGLNVNSVMTDHVDGSTVPVIDELKKGTYDKVIILLGTNELGWPSYPTFIQKYSNLLDAVWQRQPGAKIYICGLPPVTKKTDDKNSNGINNANIRKMNSMLSDLAGERGARYIDLPSSLYDSDGCLPAEASSDGIHLNLKYDRLWADHITLKVMGAI